MACQPTPAGPGLPGVRLAGRDVRGGHRRADGADLHRGTGVLPTHRGDPRPWQTVIAPGDGSDRADSPAVMTVHNLPLLMGGSTALAYIIGVALLGHSSRRRSRCRGVAAPRSPSGRRTGNQRTQGDCTMTATAEPNRRPDRLRFRTGAPARHPLSADEIRAVRRIVFDEHGLLGCQRPVRLSSPSTNRTSRRRAGVHGRAIRSSGARGSSCWTGTAVREPI